MELNLVKKKKVFGIATGCVLLIWVLFEMLMKWRDWKPLWEQIAWLMDEGIMSKTEALKYFMSHIGYANVLRYGVLGMCSLVILCVALWGSKKERLSFFAVIALFAVFIADALAVFFTIKRVITVPEAVGVSKFALLYALGGGCSTVILFFVAVSATVAATGNSFMKKTWFLPGLFYLLWVMVYFFAVPMMYAYMSDAVTIGTVITSGGVMQIFFGGGIGIMGYWISLYMPAKPAKEPVGLMDGVWEPSETVGDVQGGYQQTRTQQNNLSNSSAESGKQNSRAK